MNQKLRTCLKVAVLIATVLWAAFIFARSTKDAPTSRQESGVVVEIVRKVAPEATVTQVRKSAHVTEFFILGLLLYWDWRLFGRGSVLLPLGVGLVVAVTDELLQLTSPGRSCEVIDMLLDFIGAAAAIGLLLLLRWGKEKMLRGRRSENS